MKLLRLFWTAGLAVLSCTPGHAQTQAPPAAAVEVTAAQLRELSPTVTATGIVQSRAGADIATAVEGQLQWIAESGTWVVAGEVVARMQTDALRLQRSEQAARLTRSQVALKQAQRELERLQASGNAVSRFQLDQAQNTRDLAAADVQIFRATLSQTDERLSKAEIRAPFAGVIAERLHNAGEELTRGTAVVRLYNTEELEIRLFLPLRHVRAIRPGGIVQISVGDAYVPARVRAIVPVGDARSQSFEALIEAPRTTPALTVGHDVKVVLPLDTPQQALAVPRDAVVIRADGSAVYRINADQTAERVPVTTGVADGAWIAVTGALAEHDRVVVRGAETLHHGDPVQIVGSRPV